MNVCILQPLFPKEAAEASGFIDWILGELDRCDDTLDLIVLPEYSNAPSVYPNPDDYLADLEAFSEPLLRKVRDTCRRCGAIAAVNIAGLLKGDYGTRPCFLTGRVVRREPISSSTFSRPNRQKSWWMPAIPRRRGNPPW